MSDEGRRLGFALMEQNAIRIPNATFSCTVSADSLEGMGEAAWKACQQFFGEHPFGIVELDVDAVQNQALQLLGYTARVRARAL